MYSRGLPVIVIQSQAYDEYLQNQKYPESVLTPPTNVIDHGSENNDIVPLHPNKDKCDCSEDAETLRLNDIYNFVGPIGQE